MVIGRKGSTKDESQYEVFKKKWDSKVLKVDIKGDLQS